jgi:hypothetical protein
MVEVLKARAGSLTYLIVLVAVQAFNLAKSSCWSGPAALDNGGMEGTRLSRSERRSELSPENQGPDLSNVAVRSVTPTERDAGVLLGGAARSDPQVADYLLVDHRLVFWV